MERYARGPETGTGRAITHPGPASDVGPAVTRPQRPLSGDFPRPGTTPRVDRAETVGNMRTIDAIYESAASGETVDLS